MDIEQRAKTLTTAYIHSYNLALQEVRNPNLAAQIATAVTMVINANIPEQPCPGMRLDSLRCSRCVSTRTDAGERPATHSRVLKIPA